MDNRNFKISDLNKKLIILDSNQLILVDTDDKTLVLLENNQEIFKCKVYVAKNGIGDEIGSNKTPLGDFGITKDPDHRYGCMLRLSGYQGEVRGILIHKWYGDEEGTRGCICPSNFDMKKLFKLVKEDARLKIQR